MGSDQRANVPVCNALWIGGNLGPIAAACLASFVRRGHRVILHAYDPPRDTPRGVELADAALTIPSSKVFRHKISGSYALFSDLFRYELLRLGRGIWIDCDVYCVRRLSFDSPYVYGWQRPGSINGAVLGLPADALVLRKLIALFEIRSPILPWFETDFSAALRTRRFAGEEFTLADLPWGAAGPEALTYLLTEAGLAIRAAPQPVFYPLLWKQGPLLLIAGTDLSRLITPRTLTVHLWNETLSEHLAKMERGSPIDRLLSRGTLFDEPTLA